MRSERPAGKPGASSGDAPPLSRVDAVIPVDDLSQLLQAPPLQEDLWTNRENEEVFTAGITAFERPAPPPAEFDGTVVARVDPQVLSAGSSESELEARPELQTRGGPQLEEDARYSTGLQRAEPTLRLRVICGDQVEDLTLRGQALIGRVDPNRNIHPDVVLQSDMLVSRRHAEILLRDGRFYLMDIGSSNGTRLNRVPVTPRVAAPLRTSDTIELGDRSSIRVLEAPDGHV